MTSIQNKCIFVIFIIFFTINISCITNDSFFLKKFDEKEKSKILTEKGIVKYNEELKKNIDYSPDSFEYIKEYFIIALKYDKDNDLAEKYLDKIKSLKQYYFNKMFNIALNYESIKNKNETEEYDMLFYLEKALIIDPANENAQKLKKKYNNIYQKHLKSYINITDEIKSKLKSESDNNKKEKLMRNIYNVYYKAYLIDTSNLSIEKELKYYESKISVLISMILKESYGQIKLKQYDAANNTLNDLNQYNIKIKNKFSKEILDLKYRLYYEWGAELYKKNKLQQALNKINVALTIKKDNYLINLKSKISERLNSEYIDNFFDSILSNIDELIENESFDTAKNKIDYYLNSIKDQEQKTELENRNNLIMNKIPKLYESAINDYNNENFDESINKFNMINKVIPDYMDTKKYLEKAKNKKKLLENY